jgi:hypothetical protein
LTFYGFNLKDAHAMPHILRNAFGPLMVMLILTGCATVPSEDRIVREAEVTLVRFLEKDPDLQQWLDEAFGYAVFPEINKGGFGVDRLPSHDRRTNWCPVIQPSNLFQR